MSSLHTLYRPSTFKDVIGHDSTIKSLKKVIKEGRARSFIFTGESGVGKTTLARIMANEFARAGAKSEEKQVTVANIEEVDAATHTGVESMRTIVQKARYRAIGDSPVKAIIVDEAHRISGAAWDSLLKSIEEPPPHVYWFFCTTNAGKIPKTIKTRCQTYDLKALSEDEILAVIADVVEKASLEVNEDVMEAIAEESGGSPRQALVYLESVQFAETAGEAKRLMQKAGESKEVGDFCKWMLDGRGMTWPNAMKYVKDMEVNMEAESIRIVVSNYITKVAMNSKKEGSTLRCLHILDAFSTPYNATDKMAPLLISVGMVLGMGQ